MQETLPRKVLLDVLCLVYTNPHASLSLDESPCFRTPHKRLNLQNPYGNYWQVCSLGTIIYAYGCKDSVFLGHLLGPMV